MTWNSLEKTKSFTGEKIDIYKIWHPFLSTTYFQHWFSDNEAAVHIVANGSKKKQLQYLAVGIFKLCLLTSISIIPR